MRIRLVTPAPAHSRSGNRVTALRWRRLLCGLGHQVRIEQRYSGGECDLLVALHARRSFDSVDHFRSKHPDRPIVVALTGTDLYHDLAVDPTARAALEIAHRIVVLQPEALEELSSLLRSRTHVIRQSAVVPAATLRLRPRGSARGDFRVGVIGHLRPVKDPFRTAAAARLLPPSSRVRVIQVGAALSDDMLAAARREEAENPRYRWLGERRHSETLRILARCRLLALTSHLEGGANVLSEALALGVPIVSSGIPGAVGVLGHDYPGYYPVGDTAALAAILERTESDAGYYEALRAAVARLAPQVHPGREREAWETLLGMLAEGRIGPAASFQEETGGRQ